MRELSKQLILEHNITLEQFKELQDNGKIIIFKEYEEGFLSFVKDEQYDILFSVAFKNNYGYRLWKDLITYLDNSKRNIFMSFGDNQDRLFKAVERRYKNKYKIINENSLILIKE